MLAPTVSAYADTTSGTSGSGLPTPSPDAVALAQAEATGQSQPVPSDTTTNSTVEANPDGSFTLTDSTLPAQVQQNGTWVPVDPALHSNTDGTLSPNAVESSVTFSNGGTTPLVTLTTATGQQVALSWPNALPTPTVSGATATYADVYPGVDLAMTATIYGGYSEQLIINSATAAANPALADIHFNTTTSSGLTLSDNSAGGLQATDASGKTVFTSPTATMWSTPTTTTNAPATRSLAIRSADSTATATPTPSPSTAPSVGTDQTTDLGVNVTSSGVDLVPPAGALTASTNTYPLVIDPTLTPPPTLNDWTWVSQTDSGSSFWEGGNNTHDSDAHVGYDDWCSNGYGGCASSAFGITNTLFSFDMTRLAGKHVTGASLTTYEQGPTSSESGTRQIDLHGAGSFDSSTTWSNQPAPWAASVSGQFPSLNTNGVGSADFDVTTLIQNAVTAGYNSQTMVLEADNTGDDTAYRYLIGKGSDAPALTVTYWSTPNVPTGLSTTDGNKTTDCNTTEPGTWINASVSNTITLNASISTPDQYTSEHSDFWYHRTEPTLPSPNVWTDLGGTTVSSALPNNGASPADMTMPTLSDGQEYQWDVYNYNAGGYGSISAPTTGSGSCWFRVDFTPPSAPTLGTITPATTLGSSGSLTVSATDGGVNPSGVASFSYNMNGTSLTEGGDKEHTITTTTGSATIPLTADHWGTNTVWIATNDAAGNQSQPIHYDFYVAPSNYTPGTSGDLDGDGKPDLAVVDTTGNIRLYSNPLTILPPATTPSTTPSLSSPAGGTIMIPGSNSPTPATGFSGALVAHGGRFTGQTCDDLAVILNGALHMASENNDCTPGSGWTLGSAVPRQTNHVTGDTTNYNTSDWSSVQQEVVLPATTATNSKPALVTLEDDNGVPTLWEYEFKGTSIDQAILLATGSAWSNVTILSPGLINGTPALWVRDNATGSLTQYQNIESWSTAGGTSTTGDSIATSGYNAQQYPMITTNGPTDTTNGPTLWAVDASGRLTCLPTTVNATTFIPAVGPAVPLTSTDWAAGIQNLGTAAVPDSPGYGDIWPLSSTTQGNDIGFDSLGEATTPGNPATSSGTITYTTGHDGAVNGATVFDGSTTSLTTSTDAVDTSGSYSVSAWVKLNSASANSVFVTQGNSTTGPVADGFQLYYSATAGSYAFGRHVSGSSGAAFSPIYATAQATTNTWTHLVGVFNAATNTMTLYINGVQAATGAYSGADWSANGAVQIGRGINSGTFNQYANAAIDQVAVYGTALTTAQVAAL